MTGRHNHGAHQTSRPQSSRTSSPNREAALTEARQIILIESKLDVLKASFPLLADSLDFLSKRDPSKKGKYLQWCAKVLSTEEISLHHLADVIDNFHKNAFRLPKKDINSYQTAAELEEALFELGGSKRQQIKSQKLNSSAVYEDDQYIVVNPRDKHSSCFYGRGTKWCISATESENYFDNYDSHTIFYMIIDKQPQGTEWDKIAMAVSDEDVSNRFSAYDEEIVDGTAVTFYTAADRNVSWKTVESMLSKPELDQIWQAVIKDSHLDNRKKIKKEKQDTVNLLSSAYHEQMIEICKNVSDSLLYAFDSSKAAELLLKFFEECLQEDRANAHFVLELILKLSDYSIEQIYSRLNNRYLYHAYENKLLDSASLDVIWDSSKKNRLLKCLAFSETREHKILQLIQEMDAIDEDPEIAGWAEEVLSCLCKNPNLPLQAVQDLMKRPDFTNLNLHDIIKNSKTKTLYWLIDNGFSLNVVTQHAYDQVSEEELCRVFDAAFPSVDKLLRDDLSELNKEVGSDGVVTRNGAANHLIVQILHTNELLLMGIPSYVILQLEQYKKLLKLEADLLLDLSSKKRFYHSVYYPEPESVRVYDSLEKCIRLIFDNYPDERRDGVAVLAEDPNGLRLIELALKTKMEHRLMFCLDHYSTSITLNAWQNIGKLVKMYGDGNTQRHFKELSKSRKGLGS